MLDNLRKILNEDQDPKAIEKISEKLVDLLMRNEEVGYIAVQKKPALTVFPDSIVLTNKRIIICKPKNLGLSMGFVDYDWETIVAPLIKEGLLGAEFSFVTKTDVTVTMDYLPKNQARKLYTFAKEQLELLRNPQVTDIFNDEEAVEIEEVTDFNTFLQVPERIVDIPEFVEEITEVIQDNQVLENQNKGLGQLSKEELFEKLQNYKKLLDNGLILQGEYDTLKNEILKYL